MITLTIALLALAALYWYVTKTFDYWKQRGVRYDKPLPLFGNNFSNFFAKKSVTEVATELYWKYPDERIIGFFRSSRPELVIRDPQIAKRILTSDFLYFHRRGLNSHKTVVEPLLRNLFFADGDLWRLLRQRMTPAFTSGKLKAMFPLIVDRAQRLQERARAAAAGGEPIDSRDLMARYTTDFIGSCGFGIDSDSLSEENSAFRNLGAKIFQIGFREIVVALLKEIFPEIFKHLKLLNKVEKDLTSLVVHILKQRNHEPSGRNDFIDLMLECRKMGKIEGDSIEKFKADGTAEHATLEIDDALIAAQVFVFFAAGFETSSSATSFTLHQLAYHPAVQAKVQQDIDRVLKKYDNKLSYDAIKEMTYLEMAFKEGMRMFPSLGFLVRESTREYTFPELNVTIDKDVGVIIPLQAMQNDPKYFDDPEEFRPERFDCELFEPKNKLYLPFGEGPRACIGARLGLMQSLAGLAALLSRFSVEPAPGTPRFPRVDSASNIIQSVRGGLPLLFRERDY